MLSPQQLASVCSEFGQADPLLSDWMIIYLLQKISGNTMTPAQLASESSQFGQFDPLLSKWAMIYLLSLITNGGSTGVFPATNITYAGPPTQTPALGNLAYIVVDVNGRQWQYFNNQWN